MNVTQIMSDKLVGMDTSSGRQIWHKIVLRKGKRCCECGCDIAPKTECWAPITHQLNRWERLCLGCMTHLSRGAPVF